MHSETQAEVARAATAVAIELTKKCALQSDYTKTAKELGEAWKAFFAAATEEK